MILKIGSKGPDVERLQKALGIQADGNFGPGTEQSLKQWQEKHGLAVDGIAGPATLERLGVSSSFPPSASAPSVNIPASSFKLEKLKGHIPDAVIAQIPDTAAKFGITVLNTPGTIDADYRGEIKVILINHGTNDFVIERGTRIAQMIVAKYEHVILEEVQSLDDTARGTKGFGSTGH